MKIPTEHKWSQSNSGDIFGVLHSSHGVSFDDSGKITLSKKTFNCFNSTVDDADFGYLVSLVYYNNSYIAITEDEIFEGGLDTNGLTQVASSPNVALNSDGIVYNSLLHVTTDTQLSTWNGSSWTNSRLPVALTSGVPHVMTVFESQPTYSLAIANGNKVQTYDSSYNANSTVLTLPAYQQITTMRYRSGYLYIGTKHLNGGEARVYLWNGNGAAAQYEAPVGCSWVFALTLYKNTVAAVTSQGVLGTISGSSLVPLAVFPIYHRPHLRWQGSTGLLLNGKVFNRGLVTVGDNIYLNVDGSLENGFLPEMKSGLWVYNPDIGLHHRANSSAVRHVEDNALSVSGEVITTTTTHYLKDGDGVMFSSLSGLSGVDSDTVYYAKVVSATTLKLAKSIKSLRNEKYVTLTGTAGISDILVYVPNYDNGGFYTGVTSGAILATVYNEPTEKLWESEVVWGSRVDNRDGTAVYGLNLFAPSYTVGNFELQRVYSPNVSQSWNDFVSFIDGLSLENEEFVVKYRTNKKEETKVLTGVWLNESTINSVSLDADPWDDIEEGSEIVIVDGYGRGYSAHVVTPDLDNTTKSIVLDESFGTANKTVSFYVTNYRKDMSHTLPGDGRVNSSPEVMGGWVQLKCEMRGFEMAVAINDLDNTKDE